MKRLAQGFFWVPLVGLGIASGFGPVVSTSVATALAATSGLVVGLLWQLAGRKDVAQRLMLAACAFVAGTVMAWVGQVLGGDGKWIVAGLLFLTGTMAGVILGEAYLMRGDRERPKRDGTASQEKQDLVQGP